MNRGNLDAALPEAVSALREFSDERSEWHWRFWTLKGEILMRQGLYQESLSLLDASLPAFLAASDVAVWQRLTQAAALARISRFDEADAELSQAESLARSHHPELLGECLLRKGTLAFHHGDAASAHSEYRAALQFAQQQKNDYLEAAALGSLGVAATRLERYDESIDWNRSALRLSRSLGAMSSVARIEGNIAWSYQEMGDLENALSLFRDALRDSARAGLVADRIYWLNSAAGVEYGLRDFPAAEATSQQALDLARELNDVGTTIECLQNLALVAMQNAKSADAKQAIEEAVRLGISAPDHPRDLYTRLIAAHLAAKSKAFPQAERAFVGVIRDPLSPTSLRWEAQAGLAQVHAAQGHRSDAEREFRQAITTISKARSALEREEFRLSFLSSAIRFYDAYVSFLIARQRPADALTVADFSRAQTLAEGFSEPLQRLVVSNANLHPLQLAARFHSTLLFYWLGEQQSDLWVITPAKVALFALPPKAELESLLNSYREALVGPRDPLKSVNTSALGKKLFALLVEPAAKFIPQNARVIVFPDGSLNAFNFETLIVSKPQPHYWIEDVTITNANSLTLLGHSNPGSPPRGANLLLVGNPVPSDSDFPLLPQSATEISRIESYFPESRRYVLSGSEATPSAYLSSGPEHFAYLHFVTHGTASRTRPLESAVILSKSGDSYKLYAHDILTRPLHAYLVTISACSGAGTRIYSGEGLVGLSWAFLRAGAHNVISALWEVSDASTPQLMDRLYGELSRGRDPASALRTAKLSLLQSGGVFNKPFYWAPFQLYSGL